MSDDRPWLSKRALLVVVGVVGVLAIALVVWALQPGAKDPSADETAEGPASSAPAVEGTREPSTPPASPTEPSIPGDEAGPGEEGGEPGVGEDPGPPVALDDVAPFGNGVSARIVQMESVHGEASGIGEVAGPAIRVTIELENTTEAPLPLAAVVVDVRAGSELVPGEPLSGPGVQVFEGTLPAGATATGTYVFGVPEELRDVVQVRVSHDPIVPTVVFEGPGTPPL